MVKLTANLFLCLAVAVVFCCIGVESARLWGYRSTTNGPFVGYFDDKGDWYPYYPIPRCCNELQSSRVLTYNPQDKVFYYGRRDLLSREDLILTLYSPTNVQTVKLETPTPDCPIWQLFYEPIRKFLYGLSHSNGTAYFYFVDPSTGGTHLISKFALKNSSAAGCYNVREIGGAQYFSSTNTLYIYYEPVNHPDSPEIAVIELDIDTGKIKDQWSYIKSYLPNPVISGTGIDELALTSISNVNQERVLLEVPLRTKGETVITRETYWTRALLTNVAATYGDVYTSSMEVPGGVDHLVSLSVSNGSTLSVSVPSYMFLSSLIYVNM